MNLLTPDRLPPRFLPMRLRFLRGMRRPLSSTCQQVVTWTFWSLSPTLELKMAQSWYYYLNTLGPKAGSIYILGGKRPRGRTSEASRSSLAWPRHSAGPNPHGVGRVSITQCCEESIGFRVVRFCMYGRPSACSLRSQICKVRRNAFARVWRRTRCTFTTWLSSGWLLML